MFQYEVGTWLDVSRNTKDPRWIRPMVEEIFRFLYEEANYATALPKLCYCSIILLLVSGDFAVFRPILTIQGSNKKSEKMPSYRV